MVNCFVPPGNKSNQWIDTHHMVLHGHRSIVNQVRYNTQKCIIASSGVEKLVKLWRPFETEDWKGSLVEDNPDNLRDVFSHDEYASLLYASDHNMAHDYTQQNTTEDPRMMAFFDSLVQREIEGWNSSEDTDSDKSSQHSSDGSSRPTSPDTSDSDSPNNFLTNGNGRHSKLTAGWEYLRQFLIFSFTFRRAMSTSTTCSDTTYNIRKSYRLFDSYQTEYTEETGFKRCRTNGASC